MSEEQYWAIVQHSGYGYRHDPQFAKGVEAVGVNSARERRAVEMAGGMLFTDYLEAEAYVEKVSYPEGYTGIIPLVPGQFSSVKVSGLAVYVPVPAVV